MSSVTVEALTQTYPNTNDYDKSLGKATINLCSMSDSLGSNTFLKTFFKPLLECAPFQMKCPFPKVSEVVQAVDELIIIDRNKIL